MKTIGALALGISVMAFPSSLFAKGIIVKITIKGASLPAAVEITEGAIKDFTPWAGPGVAINGIKQTEGFIIDWKQGALSGRPSNLQRYEISFYGKLYGQGGREEPVYFVVYEYDPLVGQGYIYLPGRTDSEYRLNTTMIMRDGLEGNWFRATHAWDDFVKRFIPRGQRPAPPSPQQ